MSRSPTTASRRLRLLPRMTAAFVFVGLYLSAQGVMASPWILPQGVVVLQLSAGTDFAEREYLPDGTLQRFPLNGRFESHHFSVGARYGLVEDLELHFNTQLKGVNYNADPVIILEDGAAPLTGDEARAQVLNFNRRAAGLGDLNVGLGYQHLRGALNISSNVHVKIPTGYIAPRETFIDGNPEELGDDVTIGDGQLDLRYTLAIGAFFTRTLTLVELNMGYNLRFNGPGHQWMGQLKLGQALSDRVFLFTSARGAYTLFQGEVIGDSVVARDPGIDADDFTPDNVTAIALTLDRDYLIAEAGVILRFEGREIIVSGSRTVLGANFPQLTGVTVTTLLAFD